MPSDSAAGTAPRPFSLPAEIAGRYGSVAILAAYALSSFGYLATADRTYMLLNLTGALGVAWVCWHNRAGVAGARDGVSCAG